MDVGGAKKIKVTKAKMNALIFKDLFVEGKKKMISMNIPEIRFEQKCRQRREQVGLHTDLYTFMKSMGDNNASVPNQIKKANEKEKAAHLLNHVSHRHSLARELYNL